MRDQILHKIRDQIKDDTGNPLRVSYAYQSNYRSDYKTTTT